MVATLSSPSVFRRLGSARRPLVMGILNVTPDSFSDGGRYASAGPAIERGLRMIEEGAEVIDVGGESTRPGSRGVSVDEELARVMPVVAGLAARTAVPISIDTSKSDVAAQALAAGASLVNDITALRGDPEMARVVSRAKAAVVLMHMRGIPRTMQRQPRYRDVVEDVRDFLREAAEAAEAAGIARSRILLDPGLGFGKTVAHNLTVMRRLDRLVSLGYPVVIGPSRKSFIGRTLGAAVDERLAGTLACVAAAQRTGVHMVRVHDVRETAQLIRMLRAIGHADAARR